MSNIDDNQDFVQSNPVEGLPPKKKRRKRRRRRGKRKNKGNKQPTIQDRISKHNQKVEEESKSKLFDFLDEKGQELLKKLQERIADK